MQNYVMSRRTYQIIIGLVVSWGLLVNTLMVGMIDAESVQSINPWVFFIGYFVCAVAGVFIYNSSDDPLISFIGYNLVVVPFGFIVVLAVDRVTPDVVANAAVMTMIIVALMTTLATMYPKTFSGMGRALFWSLICLIIGELIAVLIFGYSGNIFHYLVVGLFSMYIGYDWAIANEKDATLDNAVDSAADIYMDIIILFVRLLEIFASGDD